jgi:hypothetical protein
MQLLRHWIELKKMHIQQGKFEDLLCSTKPKKLSYNVIEISKLSILLPAITSYLKLIGKNEKDTILLQGQFLENHIS